MLIDAKIRYNQVSLVGAYLQSFSGHFCELFHSNASLQNSERGYFPAIQVGAELLVFCSSQKLDKTYRSSITIDTEAQFSLELFVGHVK